MSDKLERIASYIKERFGVILPSVYYSYLKKDPDGHYGDINIFCAVDIIERNVTDETAVYSPGYMIIGDDGGDERYLMKSGENETAVYYVDAGSMSVECHSLMCEDFSEWEAEGFPPRPQEVEYVYDITLLRYPTGGTKDIARIKRVLNLTVSSAEMVRLARNAPVTLHRNVNAGKAQNWRKALGDLSELFEFAEKIRDDT